MTRSDVRLLVFLVFATILAIPAASLAGGSSHEDAVIIGPAGETRVDLSEPRTYTVEGRDGEVVFSVEDGILECISSSCDSQVCVRTHRVAPGRPVVCAPNGVSAMLVAHSGSEEASLDAISR